MTDHLPNFKSSLSKYIRVEDHYKILASIHHDLPEAEIRHRFSDELLTTLKQRYLVMNGRTVIRDRLIDLVHEEGALTQKVKMVMYFLFMLRDQRYRDFICNFVGRENGRWDTSVFRTATHTSYFSGAGGHKAFTNLRQFLLQIAILDGETFRPHFPSLEEWFPAAVEIAAQSIADNNSRKSFLKSPHGFLIRNRIHALLNSTPDELSVLDIGGTYEEADDLLPDIELDENQRLNASDLHSWNRIEPAQRKNKNKYSTINDPVKFERANQQHYALEKIIVRLCRDSGAACETNRHIDVVARFETTSVVFEMKSCTRASVRSQLRRAISQLLEYRYLYRERLGKDVRVCAVIERRPRKSAGWLLEYLGHLGIGLIWKNDEDDGLNCTEFTRELLEDLIPKVKSPDFALRIS